MMILVALFSTSLGLAQESLNCYSKTDVHASLYETLQAQAYLALDRRQEQFEAIDSAAAVATYQERLRREFVTRLGGFPDRHPLNSKVMKTVNAEGYRIENVIFESQPRHHVTANLYLPTGDGPFPAVVVSSGHSRTAKTADYNQRFGIMMARHGMVALCFDPIGQGERSQILNDQGEHLFDGTTTEHFLIGIGSILVGRNTATYRVYDAMRSIDYLTTRPEVDSSRIGMTGCSGGGTLTSYTMALDDRVLCAAPACYLTTFRRLIETIGPQDSEQNIFGQLVWGMDQTDYVLMRAPKPTLISSTTQDFFDIRGSWESFRQAKRVYGRLGFPERVDLVEIEGAHGVQPQNLATIAHWMQRWLLDIDKPVDAIELPVRDGTDLICTERGQVLSLPDELSVFDLNAQYAKTLPGTRTEKGKAATADELRNLVSERIGLPELNVEQTVKAVARQQRGKYQIEALLLEFGADIPLPINLYQPRGEASESVYLCLNDGGKNAAAELAIRLVGQGHSVVTVDLRGQGETGTGEFTAGLGDWKTFSLAYLLEQSIIGIRSADTLALSRYASERMPNQSIHLIAEGQSGMVALHAAALQPSRFASVTLRNSPRDWSSNVGISDPEVQLDHTVHGALSLYDLPDLVELAGRDKVAFANE
ncbi:MAG: alpha/beta fold hydrolase [Planctomycetota bacterium]|nr:alpha/beta fold hydrolase [Planctomycetota bacterium]